MVPEFLGALLLAGIIAAALSSASTFLSLVGFSASNDIVERDKELTLGVTRTIMFAVAFIVLIASFYFPPNIFWIMLFIGTVFGSSWGPVGFMSIWSKNITKDAAYWGIVTGFFFNVIPAALVYLDIISLASYLHPAVIGTVASVITILVVSKRGTVTTEESEYRLGLHRVPDIDLDLKKTKTTLIGAVCLIIYGIAMPVLMMLYYVIPYQRGAGHLLSDGSLDWSRGEVIVTLTIPFLWIPLGIVSAIVIWKRYNPARFQQLGSERNLGSE
jgi:hypothetical protein